MMIKREGLLDLELGPDLTDKEWATVLERHRKANIERLRSIFRKEITLTKEKRAEIECAAHGIWKFYDA